MACGPSGPHVVRTDLFECGAEFDEGHRGEGTQFVHLDGATVECVEITHDKEQVR